MTVYCSPAGKLRDADRERELIEMAIADACGFEYFAPDELAYAETDGPDWWSVFWDSIERYFKEAQATGQRSIGDFAAVSDTGGRSA